MDTYWISIVIYREIAHNPCIWVILIGGEDFAYN